jgi:hypothetical protein
MNNNNNNTNNNIIIRIKQVSVRHCHIVCVYENEWNNKTKGAFDRRHEIKRKVDVLVMILG